MASIAYKRRRGVQEKMSKRGFLESLKGGVFRRDGQVGKITARGTPALVVVVSRSAKPSSVIGIISKQRGVMLVLEKGNPAAVAVATERVNRCVW